MRTIVTGSGADTLIYRLIDPDAQSEIAFEAQFVQTACQLFRQYHCIVFGGGFHHDDRLYRPDLALVAKDFSHWFVIEVELVSHSLYGHVLPQVRAFQYGRPGSDCAAILSRELGVGIEQMRTLISFVPRSVAVVANKHEQEWNTALRAVNVQLLTLSVFGSDTGQQAVAVDGALDIISESLGFGIYVATDRSLRFQASLALPLGVVEIDDAESSLGTWFVAKEGRSTWLTKESGRPDIEDGSHIQLLRTQDKRLILRRPAR